MMDIFGRIKIFGSSGNGCTFFIQDHHPFSDGSTLKLDSLVDGEKMVKLMVVNSSGNDPLKSKHDLAIIPFKNGSTSKGIIAESDRNDVVAR